MRSTARNSTVFGSMVVACLLTGGAAFASGQPSGEPVGTARGVALQSVEGPGQIWGSIRSEGQFAIGFRGVSQSGSETRYDKDVDLSSGVRILDTHWVLSPANRNAGAWFDRAVIDINGAGGDPYQLYSVSLYKTGKYRFDARTRKADYKWAVGDSHNIWDTTRRYTDVRLAVTPVKNLELYAVYGRYSQQGDNVGTIDISRNEFEVGMPADTTSQTWAVGARYNRNRTSMFFEQEFYELKDVVARASGPNSGLSPDGAELEIYNEREVRGITAPITKAGVNTWLADNRVQLNGDILYSKQNMDYAWDSFWAGLDFTRRETAEAEGSNGLAEREVLHGNFFAGFHVARSAQLTARYRHRSWDQSGANTFTAATFFTAEDVADFGFDAAVSSYEITDNQVLVGAKGLFRKGSVYGEVGFSNREQIFDSPVLDENVDTSTAAFRLGGTFRPSRVVDLKVSYDYGDVDDPFTRISPSKVNAFRLRVNSRPAAGLVVGGHYRYRDVQNTVTDFEFTQKGFGLHSTYDWGVGRYFTVAYTRNDIDQMIPITFIFPFFGNPTDTTALQDLANNIFTVAADVTVSTSFPLAIYGSASIVTSDSDESGFLSDAVVLQVVQLDFYDIRAGARYTLSRGLFLDGEARFIDYQDGGVLVGGADNYDAAIFTLKVGFAFK